MPYPAIPSVSLVGDFTKHTVSKQNLEKFNETNPHRRQGKGKTWRLQWGVYGGKNSKKHDFHKCHLVSVSLTDKHTQKYLTISKKLRKIGDMEVSNIDHLLSLSRFWDINPLPKFLTDLEKR